MRISTGQMSTSALNAMLERQVDLNKTQLQVATGKKALTPSDDPVASAASLGLEQTKSVTERYQTNADAAEARLSVEEAALDNVGNQLQRVRELVIQGSSSATLTDENRAFIASEVKELLNGMVQAANTKDNNGQYLFSGNRGDTAPFVRTASGNFQYQGDDGQRHQQVGPTHRVADADPGSKVFADIRTGNGDFDVRDVASNTGGARLVSTSVTDHTAYQDHSYQIDFIDNAGTMEYTVTDTTTGAVTTPATPYVEGGAIEFDGISVTFEGQPDDGDSFNVAPSGRQNLFDTVKEVVDALESDTSLPGGEARLSNALQRGLSNLDAAHENILGIRAKVGGRMNSIEHERAANDNMVLQVEKTMSKLNDVDLAEAIAQMNQQMASLQAAQQSFSKIQGLSLFNYM